MQTDINVEKINDKNAKIWLTGVRLTWVWLTKPQENMTPGSFAYKVTGLISLADYKSKIRPAIEKAAQKLLGNSSVITDPKKRAAVYAQSMADGKQKSLFKKGDDQTDAEGKIRPGCQGMMLFTAHTNAEDLGNGLFKPIVPIKLVDRKTQPIPEHAIQSELYNGVFANVGIVLSPYTKGGAPGLTFYLNVIQKVKDGERLGGSDAFASMAAMEDEEESESSVPDFGEEEEAPKKGKGKKK